MAYMVMNYIVVACIAIAYIVMVYIVMAYRVLAYIRARKYRRVMGFFFFVPGVCTLGLKGNLKDHVPRMVEHGFTLLGMVPHWYMHICTQF